MSIFPFKLEVYAINGGTRSLLMRLDLTTQGIYTLGRNPDQSIRIDDQRVSREHLELAIDENSIVVTDNNSTNRTYLNRKQINSQEWNTSDVLSIGTSHEIIFLSKDTSHHTTNSEDLHKDRDDSVLISLHKENSQNQSYVEEAEFERLFEEDKILDADEILGSQFYSAQTEFAAIGAGIGSFVWVDCLRIFGVPAEQIITIGDNKVCYANYERYCKNSQIPLYERLRSNSASTPDNLWGFPGYASREFMKSMSKFSLKGMGGVFAVFGEPVFAQSYVPTADHVFRSLDKEMTRISWNNMFKEGRVYKIRKTSDGRYAIGFKNLNSNSSSNNNSKYSIHIARIVHVATGYPAINVVPDLGNFLAKNPDRRSLMVNAYDPHDQVYEQIREQGNAVVIIRGRGIVASRIIQRLAEDRAKNNLDIQIIHLMRGERKFDTGAVFRRTRRPVFNDVEVQPFNWPKSCWSGTLRRDIEEMTPANRSYTYDTLGGTSTAIRSDWTKIIETGLEEGWYKKVYGTISDIVPDDDTEEVNFVIERSGQARRTDTIYADFIIDCTGLIADISLSPLINDLIISYDLKRSISKPAIKDKPAKLAGLAVSNHFEVIKMKNKNGRFFVSGQLAGGGPYAPVDSFLGLQYAALRSVDHLSMSDKAVPKLGPIGSMFGWLKWCFAGNP